MVPASFDESNAVLDKSLSVLKTHAESGTPMIVSCWKLTQEEVDKLLRTGRVWLTVCGVAMPPVALSVNKPWE